MLLLPRATPCGMLAIMVLLAQTSFAEAKSRETVAISATVSGNDQRVGFRAMVMKQAIEYNLAGIATNAPNDVVVFTL